MGRIRRDYSRPFFSQRRGIGSVRLIIMFGVVIVGFLVFVSLRFNSLQLAALDVVGMAPTSTPFASDYAAQGMELYWSGDVSGALRMIERAVQQQPENPNYLYEYGHLLMENDRFTDSVPIADRLIRIAPNDPRGYALKGRALMWSDPATAIQVSIQGTDVDPTYAPLLAVQGVAYTNLGRWQEGIRQGQRAVELDPNDAFVQRSLSFPLSYVGRWQDAIDALERSILVNPNLTATYFELAALYKLPQVNQPDMAVAIYNHIIELEPNSAKAYLRLCETFAGVEQARFDIAQPYCDRAIQIDNTYASAYRQRGQMQYNRRNYEGAIDSLEECVRLGSTEIACWYIRGLAHFWLGQCDVAWDLLTESQVMGQEQGAGAGVMTNIEIGLGNITELCAGYSNQPLPTPIPPTPIPPTPIGGFG